MVNFMAGVTVGRGSLVDTIDVAGIAGGGGVCPGKRIRCLGMVECSLPQAGGIESELLPVGAVVAGSAASAQRAVMYVVNFMAGVAVGRGSIEGSVNMAGSAGDGGVCSGDWEC